MKVPGTLAIYGVLLLVIQVGWPFTHRFANLPINLAGICFTLAVVWGVARGSDAVRFVVFLWLCGFAVIAFGVLAEPRFIGTYDRPGLAFPPINPVLAALGAALLALGVLQGILAYRAETATKSQGEQRDHYPAPHLMTHRTPAYWPTRFLLAVGFIATVVALATTLYLMTQGPIIDARPDVLGLPADIALRLAGLVPVLVGFAWMVRIFHGPRDEPPLWRYRDR